MHRQFQRAKRQNACIAEFPLKTLNKKLPRCKDRRHLYAWTEKPRGGDQEEERRAGSGVYNPLHYPLPLLHKEEENRL